MVKVCSGEAGFMICGLLGAILRAEPGLPIVKYTPRVIVAWNGYNGVLEVYPSVAIR